MRTYTVTAEFPAAVGSQASQSTTVRAGSIPAALNKSMKELIRRDGVARRRHKAVLLSIVLHQYPAAQQPNK